MKFALPDNPEVDMGGQGLYGTVPEYLKFIRMWLNDGDGLGGRVLKPEAVEWAAKGALLAPQKVTVLPRRDPVAVKRRGVFP